MKRHRRTILNPHHGPIGLLAMPTVVLEFVSPLFWFGGLTATIVAWALGWITTLFAASVLVASFGLGAVLTFAAIAVDELNYRTYRTRSDMLRLLLCAVVEMFYYRQLNELWRGLGYVDIARGTTGWGDQQRRGFASAPE
jgi:poly-beta-1,6-N-acetyl-D-glucosamine synthase